MVEGIDKNRNDAIIINEVQLLLAAKRTSLATLRTGIAIFALPLTLISFLIATSKFYNIQNILYLFLPLMLACLILGVFGIYLAVRAIRKIRRLEEAIAKLKSNHSRLSGLIF